MSRKGRLCLSVRLSPVSRAGLIPAIHNVNASTEVWGPDAAEYNPERYAHAPSKEQQDALNSVPGVYGNMLTFLGGGRNCIGYRFALVEIMAMLFVLLRSFTFDELASKPVIEKKSE